MTQSKRSTEESCTRYPYCCMHDNAPAHKSHVRQAALHECGFEEMHHSPYFLDLVPSDYHLFPNLKKYLRGQRFSTDSELKHATDE